MTPGLSTELKDFLFSSWLYIILEVHLLKNWKNLEFLPPECCFLFFLIYRGFFAQQPCLPGQLQRLWQWQQWRWLGGAEEAVEPAGGAGAATKPLALFPPLFPFRALHHIEQGGLVGMGQTPAYWDYLYLSGIPRWQHTSSKYCTSLSGFCTCSGVKFQNTRGAHHPRHLPMLSHTPSHS